MNRKQILGLIGAVLVVALGIGLYSVFRTPEAATGVTAIPLASNATNPPSNAAAPTATTAPTTNQPNATDAPATSAPTEASQPSGGTTLLELDATQSEARFVIDEVLNNAPKTVVGTTKLIAGQIEVNAQDPSQSRVGVIQVNARDLTTDSEFRNRAIKNQILNTNDFEFVTFTPKTLTGLPTTGEVGKSYTFQMTGDLTIRDVTKEVTFDVTVTPDSATSLKGLAQTTIKYADFNITIPSVRQVASVSDEVRLELEFVAQPVK